MNTLAHLHKMQKFFIHSDIRWQSDGNIMANSFDVMRRTYIMEDFFLFAQHAETSQNIFKIAKVKKRASEYKSIGW